VNISEVKKFDTKYVSIHPWLFYRDKKYSPVDIAPVKVSYFCRITRMNTNVYIDIWNFRSSLTFDDNLFMLVFIPAVSQKFETLTETISTG
jgi:hypothetical protein